MGVANLGYVILQMKDPSGWAKFAENVLGFTNAERDDAKGAQFLRMDEAPFRYMILQGDSDKFIAGGYDLGSEIRFVNLVETLRAHGVDVIEGASDEARRRSAKAYACFQDPSGNWVEIFHGRDKNAPFTAGHGIDGFNTGEMGLGHMVLPAPNNDETIEFYLNVMGFEVSDDLTLPAFAEGMPEQRVYFMHADNPRHHTLGLYNFPNPTGVIHLMAEMNNIDEVGLCMDRVKAAGLHIFASLGRHANDDMVSFYFFAPGGIGFEVGYDGKTVKDWSKYTATKSTIGDIWGHEYDFPVVGDA